jgi:hypothetical protein
VYEGLDDVEVCLTGVAKVKLNLLFLFQPS